MKPSEVDTLKKLIKKYNSVLTHSMSIAISEDLINLIVVNGDDKGFQLTEIIKNKEKFRTIVSKEFFKINATSITTELKSMPEEFIPQKMKKK